MFSGSTVLPYSKETELRSSDQEAFPSACKNTGVVVVPCSLMEVHPYSFLVVWIFVRSLGVICYSQLVLYEFHKKILQGLVSHELAAFLSIFNLFKLDELCPYYGKYLNQVILNSITL